MCLEGKRGVTRALESELKEPKFIKRRAELGWTEADDKNISVLNRLTELRVENGELVLKFELDPRPVQTALHDLGFDKKNVTPLASVGANDVQFTCQDELPEDDRIYRGASGVFGSGSSTFKAASETGSEKDAGAYFGCLESAEEN